jgi:hypothetical protein
MSESSKSKRDLRINRHRAVQNAALSEAGHDVTPSSLREAIEMRAALSNRTVWWRQDETRALGVTVLALCSVAVAVGGFAVSSLIATAVGVIGVSLCAMWWWRNRFVFEQRTWAAMGAAVVVVLLIGVVGASTQTVTQNGVVRQGGAVAQTLEQVEMLRSDIVRLAEWKDLSVEDDNAARVDAQLIKEAIDAAVLLAGAKDESWRTPELGEAARRIRSAAGYMRDALAARYDTAMQFDQQRFDQIGPSLDLALEQALAADELLSVIEKNARGE